MSSEPFTESQHEFTTTD